MTERLALGALLWTLGMVRWAMGRDARLYALLSLPALQPALEWIARLRARHVFLEARHRCPAYAAFLAARDYAPRRPWRLADVPVTTKENYVRAYSIEERCFGGRIPSRGVMIDESSGSSGVPNNWVRSASERRDVKHILQLSYDLLYPQERRIILNCFALGPWATGMNVSMSLVDVGILKSIGPDAAKLEATLRTFGPGYEYLVAGYPPFLKAFVDGTALDLAPYAIDWVVGGEGISEAMRSYLERFGRSVRSSYGASDLEINLGVETAFTVALRRACAHDPALCAALFGRDMSPMIFQYNPLDMIVETLDSGTMAFTLGRVDGAAPRVRYDLKDVGGTRPMRELDAMLRARGLDPAALAGPRSAFPVLWVFGRADLSVAFFGAKVTPGDVEAVVLGDTGLAPRVRSFRIGAREDERADRTLVIDLELAPGAAPGAAELAPLFYRGLAAANQDFREVTRMFDASKIMVVEHAHGTGPFTGADIRVKSRYLGDAPAP